MKIAAFLRTVVKIWFFFKILCLKLAPKYLSRNGFICITLLTLPKLMAMTFNKNHESLWKFWIISYIGISNIESLWHYVLSKDRFLTKDRFWPKDCFLTKGLLFDQCIVFYQRTVFLPKHFFFYQQTVFWPKEGCAFL